MAPDYRLEPCRTALNRVRGMYFEWSLNPYMGCAHRCTFCYVRAFEHRADRPADDRYGRSIRVKPNIAERLNDELSRPSWARAEVAIGAATDPYQPAEGRFRLTRACIEVLARHRNPFGIITRSPLILRDLDVLAAAARRTRVRISLSIPTLRDDVWRSTEPSAPPPRARLRAVRALADAGLHVSVGVAPLIPGLSDDAEGLGDVVRAARDAGARSLWSTVLYLRPGTREHFLAALTRDWPAEAERYRRTFTARSNFPATESDAVLDRFRAARDRVPMPPLPTLLAIAGDAADEPPQLELFG